jgi:predicted 3-demethylubiquinone-9 3-methyltransferase (glyoxalase superfamily)
MKSVYTCLWFDNDAHLAVAHYQRVFGDKISVEDTVATPDAAPGETGHPMVVPFEINGQRFVGLNGGPLYPLTECVSIQVHCDDQDEIDRYWDGLLEGDGEESQCGWLKDRFGLSWQIVPARLIELMSSGDQAVVERVTAAFMPMRKLDLATIEAAVAGA